MHQILILNAEARRKDHIQMMTHHIITVILVVTSYFTNFTRVGCVIMVLMDCCDIFLGVRLSYFSIYISNLIKFLSLQLAKMIRYLNISQLACDLMFGFFMLFWVVTRHVLFLHVTFSLIFTAPRLIDMQWAPEKGYYFDNKAHMMFCGLLCSLQVCLLYSIFVFG
jgi:acyl-CoA-dependent ceramide synthase